LRGDHERLLTRGAEIVQIDALPERSPQLPRERGHQIERLVHARFDDVRARGLHLQS